MRYKGWISLLVLITILINAISLSPEVRKKSFWSPWTQKTHNLVC